MLLHQFSIPLLRHGELAQLYLSNTPLGTVLIGFGECLTVFTLVHCFNILLLKIVLGWLSVLHAGNGLRSLILLVKSRVHCWLSYFLCHICFFFKHHCDSLNSAIQWWHMYKHNLYSTCMQVLLDVAHVQINFINSEIGGDLSSFENCLSWVIKK